MVPGEGSAAGRRSTSRPRRLLFLLVTPPTDGAPSGAEPTPPVEPSRPAPPAAPGPVAHPVEYKGAELDPERGPGLGCFRFQVIVLVVLLVATPIGVNAGWPDWLTIGMLFTTLALLLVAGQTIIFLLRLVAADRRSRRRPLRSQTPTVGELTDDADVAADATDPPAADDPIQGQGGGDRSVRQ